MNISLTFVIFVTIYFSFCLAGVIRLKMANVKSILPYIAAFIITFPIIVLLLNVVSVIFTKDKDIREDWLFIRIFIAIIISMYKLPLFMALLCKGIKLTEDRLAKCDSKKSKEIIKQSYHDYERIVLDFKSLRTA